MKSFRHSGNDIQINSVQHQKIVKNAKSIASSGVIVESLSTKDDGKFMDVTLDLNIIR